MPSNYPYIFKEHQADYGRKLTVWAQDHLANRYSDRTHFIFELLQNAEDALSERENVSLPTSVNFTLLHNGLEVRHFGKPFTPENVKSICAINESTKKDELTEIGCFGIGFKSVYAFTKRPEIHSGGERFAIEGFVLPVEVPPKSTSDGETLFWIPFAPDDSTAVSEIATALTNLGARRLLFLKAVTEISWSTPDGTKGLFFKNPPQSDKIGHRIHLLGEIEGKKDPTAEEWLLFSRAVKKPDDRAAGNVEIAFQLNVNGSESTSIQSVADSKLVVFFPTEVSTGLGCLIQGPYRTTPSRDVVPPNDSWNRLLVNETAELLITSLHSLKEGGLLGVDALRTLPIEARAYPVGGMLRPLFEKVANALKSEELLPIYGGGHRAGQKCRLARGEGLRELFNSNQLAALLGASDEVWWISEEITQNKAATLREFLMQQVDIVEITPESLVPRLDESFFKQQSDQWMSRFYSFLSGQKAVLRDLVRRGTPFIRCHDDSHVPPKLGELPQAFLPSMEATGFRTVKSSVCDTNATIEFLRSLGLSEPDPVDDVIQNVLCHYFRGKVSRSEIDYNSDLARIHTAFATDSDLARRKLLDGLKSAHFVKAVNTETGEARFLQPEKTYRATQRIKEVFSGVKKVWIVDDKVAGLRGESARVFLTACGALDVIRVIPSEGDLSWEEKNDLRIKAGSNTITWERIDDDAVCPELEALIAALGALTKEKARDRAAEFWLLLRETLRDRRDSYFQARYVWGYGQRQWQTSFPASWVSLLRNSRWIPDSNGELRVPSEVCFSDVYEKIRNAAHPFLTEILGFRPEAIKELAAKEGIDLETLNLLKRHNVSAEQLRKFLGETDDQNEADEEEQTEETEEVEQEEPDTDEVDEVEGEENQEDGEESGCSDSNSGGTGRGERGTNGGSGGGGSGKPKNGGGQGKRFHTYVSVNADSNPANDEGLSSQDLQAIESAAIDFIIMLEPQLERTPTNNPGFDLFEGESIEDPIRFVEIKAKKGEWSGPVALSDTQFLMAEAQRERFWLYVVEYAQDTVKRRVHKLQDPVGKSQYYSFDAGWKAIANFEQHEEEEAHDEIH